MVRHALRPRGGGEPTGSWWGPGTREPTGNIFGETPRPPGVKREWEDWEAPYYLTMVVSAVILTVGLSSRPNTSLVGWAHEEAARRLAESDA